MGWGVLSQQIVFVGTYSNSLLQEMSWVGGGVRRWKIKIAICRSRAIAIDSIHPSFITRMGRVAPQQNVCVETYTPNWILIFGTISSCHPPFGTVFFHHAITENRGLTMLFRLHEIISIPEAAETEDKFKNTIYIRYVLVDWKRELSEHLY